MSDLINRDEVIAHFQRIREASEEKGDYNEGFVDGLDYIISFISTMPSAESEQPIRCKDCKHRPVVRDPDEVGSFGLEFPDDECPCNCDDPFYAFRPADDWYCARGEKKGDKNE